MLPPALAARVAQSCDRNLRRALLSLEACKVQQFPFAEQQPVPGADWELYLQEIANDIHQEQSARRLYQTRGKLYELLVNCIPAELVLKRLLQNLLGRLDETSKHEAVKVWAGGDAAPSARPRPRKPPPSMAGGGAVRAPAAGGVQGHLPPRGVRRAGHVPDKAGQDAGSIAGKYLDHSSALSEERGERRKEALEDAPGRFAGRSAPRAPPLDLMMQVLLLRSLWTRRRHSSMI